jgi:hypothetical protein
MKYAKIVNNIICFPPKNKGSIVNYNLDTEQLLLDGYKEFIEAERPETNRFYHIEYIETDVITETIVYDETQEEADNRELQNAKNNKITQNDNLRDIALNQGVTYQNILFDSDTDQKVNLLAIVSTMGDEDTVEWFGMNNDVLICTKADLIAIGELITQLHTFCWTKNAEIKEAIAEAQTIEEVNEIEVNYEN